MTHPPFTPVWLEDACGDDVVVNASQVVAVYRGDDHWIMWLAGGHQLHLNGGRAAERLLEVVKDIEAAQWEQTELYESAFPHHDQENSK